AYLELLGGIIYLDNPNKFLDEVKKSMGLFAHEVMTEDVITVLPETEVEQAANLLVRKKIKRLPVLDENDKLIGIVARKDIMTHLFHNERSEEHTSELQSRFELVCRLLLEKKKY